MASLVATTFFALMAVIQVCIAVGLLPVTIVWGGSQQERTLQNSLASLVAACILVGMAAVMQPRRQLLHVAFALRVGSLPLTWD